MAYLTIELKTNDQGGTAAEKRAYVTESEGA